MPADLSSARKKIQDKSTLCLVNPDFPSAALVEFLGRSGFDGAFLDCEHQFAGIGQIHDMIRAAHYADMLAFVRPEVSHPAILTRYLDAGADGLILPHVETAEQCEELVKVVREARYSDYQEKYIFVLLESVSGLRNLAGIARVDGLAGIMFGAVDLSQSMGFPGQPQHPDVRRAIEEAIPLVHAGNLLAGAPSSLSDLQAKRCSGGYIVSVHVRQLLQRASAGHLSALMSS